MPAPITQQLFADPTDAATLARVFVRRFLTWRNRRDGRRAQTPETAFKAWFMVEGPTHFGSLEDQRWFKALVLDEIRATVNPPVVIGVDFAAQSDETAMIVLEATTPNGTVTGADETTSVRITRDANPVADHIVDLYRGSSFDPSDRESGS